MCFVSLLLLIGSHADQHFVKVIPPCRTQLSNDFWCYQCCGTTLCKENPVLCAGGFLLFDLELVHFLSVTCGYGSCANSHGGSTCKLRHWATVYDWSSFSQIFVPEHFYNIPSLNRAWCFSLWSIVTWCVQCSGINKLTLGHRYIQPQSSETD